MTMNQTVMKPMRANIRASTENQIGDHINEEVDDDQKEACYMEEEDGRSSGVDSGDIFDDYESDCDEADEG